IVFNTVISAWRICSDDGAVESLYETCAWSNQGMISGHLWRRNQSTVGLACRAITNSTSGTQPGNQVSWTRSSKSRLLNERLVTSIQLTVMRGLSYKLRDIEDFAIFKTS